MKIASLVVRTPPQHIEEVRESLLKRIPGAEVHGTSAEKGCLIVTVEDVEGHSLADALASIHYLDNVMDASLSYEYTDENPTPEPAEI